MARAVARDMESIFGPAVRMSRPALAPRAEPEVRNRSRRWAGIAAVGLLTATTVGGMIAGKSVTATRPAAVDPVRTSTPRAAPLPRTATVASAAAIASPIETVEPAEMAAPPAHTAEVPVTPAAAERIDSEPVRPPVSAPVPERPVTAPAPAPVIYRAPPAPAPTRAAPTRIVVDCDRDPQACFAARVEWADRRTGAAFHEAAAAGVRPRMLREYRSEWNRARGESIDRPGEALRLMAMITHDLEQLTDEAAAKRAGLR